MCAEHAHGPTKEDTGVNVSISGRCLYVFIGYSIDKAPNFKYNHCWHVLMIWVALKVKQLYTQDKHCYARKLNNVRNQVDCQYMRNNNPHNVI